MTGRFYNNKFVALFLLLGIIDRQASARVSAKNVSPTAVEYNEDNALDGNLPDHIRIIRARELHLLEDCCDCNCEADSSPYYDGEHEDVTTLCICDCSGCVIHLHYNDRDYRGAGGKRDKKGRDSTKQMKEKKMGMGMGGMGSYKVEYHDIEHVQGMYGYEDDDDDDDFDDDEAWGDDSFRPVYGAESAAGDGSYFDETDDGGWVLESTDGWETVPTATVAAAATSPTYWDDFDWEELPEHIQKAAAVLGYNDVMWDDCESAETDDYSWSELSFEQQQAAQVFGYNQRLWDGVEEEAAASADASDNGNNDASLSDGSSYWDDYWNQLPNQAQAAAMLLGYEQQTWDNGSGVFTDEMDWDDLNSEQQNAAGFLGYNRESWNGDSADDSTSSNIAESDAGGWEPIQINEPVGYTKPDIQGGNNDHSSVSPTYWDNFFWNELPSHIQEAASVLGYNEVMWDMSQTAETDDYSWSELSVEQQHAAEVFGYNQDLWDNGVPAAGSGDDGNITPSQWENAYWNQLPQDVKDAAVILGYHQQSWDSDSGAFTDGLDWDDLTSQEQQAARVFGYNRESWNSGGATLDAEIEANSDNENQITFDDESSYDNATEMDDEDLLSDNNSPENSIEDSTNLVWLDDNDVPESNATDDSSGDLLWMDDLPDNSTEAWNDMFWADLPNDIQSAAGLLGYNGIIWDHGLKPYTDDMAWSELNGLQQQAATTLGYNQATWDGVGGSADMAADTSDVSPTYWDNFFWNELPEDIQDAATVLGYNEVMWDMGQMAETDNYDWSELSAEQQQAATVFGYDQDLWDNGAAAGSGDGTGNISPGQWDDAFWNQLPQDVQGAAMVLGYQQQNWDNDSGAFTDNLEWDELDGEQQQAAGVFGYTRDSWNSVLETTTTTSGDGVVGAGRVNAYSAGSGSAAGLGSRTGQADGSLESGDVTEIEHGGRTGGRPGPGGRFGLSHITEPFDASLSGDGHQSGDASDSYQSDLDGRRYSSLDGPYEAMSGDPANPSAIVAAIEQQSEDISSADTHVASAMLSDGDTSSSSASTLLQPYSSSISSVVATKAIAAMLWLFLCL